MKIALTRTMNHQLGFKIQSGEESWEGALVSGWAESRRCEWIGGRLMIQRSHEKKCQIPKHRFADQMGTNLTAPMPWD